MFTQTKGVCDVCVVLKNVKMYKEKTKPDVLGWHNVQLKRL